MNDIMKIIQALILLKGVNKTIKKQAKEQKGGFWGLRAGSGNKKGKGIVRTGTGKLWDF